MIVTGDVAYGGKPLEYENAGKWLDRLTAAVGCPKTAVKLDRDAAVKVLKLVSALEDLDDVQHVAGNFDISDEILKAIEGELG